MDLISRVYPENHRHQLTYVLKSTIDNLHFFDIMIQEVNDVRYEK